MEPRESLVERERAIVEALRRIIRSADLHSRRLGVRHGLTAPQLAALQEIHRARALSAGEVARRIHLSPGTVSGILARLGQRGLVRRVASAQDRRRVELRATPAGARLLERSPSLLRGRFRRALARLADWEQSMLVTTLQRTASLMEEGDGASPPAARTPTLAGLPSHLSPEEAL